MSRKRKRRNKAISIITILLIAISSWALFDLVKTLFLNLLDTIGITNYILQLTMLLIFSLIILSILGISYYKAFKSA